MDSAVNSISSSFSISSFADLGLVIGIICALGFFLLHKGKITALPKR